MTMVYRLCINKRYDHGEADRGGTRDNGALGKCIYCLWILQFYIVGRVSIVHVHKSFHNKALIDI